VILLLDQNLSRKLIRLLRDDFTDISHVGELELAEATDREIWEYAKQHDLIIVSKDSDFRQLALLLGPPPKVVWVNVPNASTSMILDVIRQSREAIINFSQNAEESYLALSGEQSEL
jgi:predicted nuclease of predicted toxin-antitoxin system